MRRPSHSSRICRNTQTTSELGSSLPRELTSLPRELSSRRRHLFFLSASPTSSLPTSSLPQACSPLVVSWRRDCLRRAYWQQETRSFCAYLAHLWCGKRDLKDQEPDGAIKDSDAKGGEGGSAVAKGAREDEQDAPESLLARAVANALSAAMSLYLWSDKELEAFRDTAIMNSLIMGQLLVVTARIDTQLVAMANKAAQDGTSGAGVSVSTAGVPSRVAALKVEAGVAPPPSGGLQALERNGVQLSSLGPPHERVSSGRSTAAVAASPSIWEDVGIQVSPEVPLDVGAGLGALRGHPGCPRTVLDSFEAMAEALALLVADFVSNHATPSLALTTVPTQPDSSTQSPWCPSGLR